MDSAGFTKSHVGLSLQPIVGGQPLEKQDSAYGLERDALRSLPRPNPSQDNDAVFWKEVASYGQPVPAELSTADSHSGKAASLTRCGPPKPSCNDARLDNLNELGLLTKASGDPQIRKILPPSPYPQFSQ